MGIKRNGYPTSKSERAVVYSDMRGVDFSGAGENEKRYRFSHLENMYKDYSTDGSGIIESIPGFRKIASLSGKIHAIYSHRDDSNKEFLIVHSKNELYRLNIQGSSYVVTRISEIENRRSTSFSSGKNLFILDGKRIIKIKPDGTATVVTDTAPEESRPYVPTLYVNGKEHEQRNLLTRSFREVFKIGSADEYASATEGLKYKILSEEEGTCSVSGIDPSVSGEVRIPSNVYIGDKRYLVKSIGFSALSYKDGITRVVIAEGVEKIESAAFQSSKSLTEIIIPNSVTRIESSVFVSCTALSRVYLSSALTFIGYTVFAGCTALAEIHYPLGEDSFLAINNKSNFSASLIKYNSYIREISISVRPCSRAVSIEKAWVNGSETAFGVTSTGGIVGALIFPGQNASDFDGSELEILGTLSDTQFTTSPSGKSFLEEEGTKISAGDAIRGCTLAESFDGRIFISGCDGLPNTVFYSSRDRTGKNNPLYFGAMNYFNDGTGTYPVRSLLVVGDSLAVFKSSHDGEGSIYYHTPKDTGIDIIPKIYPTSFVHSGICALGDSISFLDDPVFICELGLCALDKQTINLERSISIRSHNINPKLLSENLSDIRLTRWQGYLVLSVGGRMYLADSRMTFKHPSGGIEYEWFYLSGIGTHRYDSKVYRYASVAEPGYSVHEKAGEKTDMMVYGASTSNGGYVYYVGESPRYQVIPTEEMKGGSFYGATAVHSPDRNLLYFGTENGDVCIFNTDKKITSGTDKGKIPLKYYSFANHAPTYALQTARDNLGIPYLTKRTVKRSLTIKLKSFGDGVITVEAGTDKSGYSESARITDGSINFESIDFSHLSFKNTDSYTALISEKEKGWVEKSISVYTREYSSPFGIYSISYRFTLDGKIKN